jgi:DNA-binding HxlR family transcriptional regulator
MEKHSLADACYVRDLLNRVIGGWAPLVLRAIGAEERRFSYLEREVEEISRRMLAKTLRVLEEDGLVLRRVHATKPISVTYRLSELGAELLPLMESISQWALTNEHRILAARAAYQSVEAVTELASRSAGR